MRKLLEYILDELVGKGEYKVEEIINANVITFNITANPDKMGRMIGKGGNIIKSIQDILHIKSKLENSEVYINIKEV